MDAERLPTVKRQWSNWYSHRKFPMHEKREASTVGMPPTASVPETLRRAPGTVAVGQTTRTVQPAPRP